MLANKTEKKAFRDDQMLKRFQRRTCFNWNSSKKTIEALHRAEDAEGRLKVVAEETKDRYRIPREEVLPKLGVVLKKRILADDDQGLLKSR